MSSSPTPKRHFLATVAVVGFVLFLLALHGPRSTYHDGVELPQLDSDEAQHPPRALLQASHRPALQGNDGEDDDEEITSTPSRPVVHQTTHHTTEESIPEAQSTFEDEAAEEERNQTLAMLRRRGWQSQLEVERAVDILRRTDELLTKAGRDYFLTDGTLLGYCRHDEAFTPWDDDMDIMTSRDNMNWLLSDEGHEQIAAHGLELKKLGSGKYHKLFLAGKDIPRAGGVSWGYPFLDVFPYDLNVTTGLIDVHSSSSKEPSIYLPPRRVSFHHRAPNGVLVPNQAGLLLDMLFPEWRTRCKMEGYNHRLEEGDDSYEGDCVEMARLLGVKLAPPQRCPSASMRVAHRN